MKLLHVVPTYFPATRYGGPIHSVHGLCAALVRRGHDVDVLTTNVDGPGELDVPIGAPVQVDGVRVRYFPTGVGRRLYRSPAMKHALCAQMEQTDVIHLHSVFLWPTSMAAAMARRSGIPYLLAPRGMLVGNLIQRKNRLLKSAWIQAFERRNLAGAAAVHVTSSLERDEIVRLGLPVRRFAVVANGTDAPKPTSHGSRDTGFHLSRVPTILALGRLSWKKGLDRLIRSLTAVPDARLVIAGNDEEAYQPRLEHLVRSMGLTHRVEFHGPVAGADKWALLAAADVLALPSYSENFGNVVLEAMACGTPVLVTAEVGLAAAVRDSGAGLVVEGTPEAIAAGLTRLLDAPDVRARMGEAGRRTVRCHYAWDAIAQRMEAEYEVARSQTLRPNPSTSTLPRRVAGAGE